MVELNRLKKEEALHERDEKGNFIPQELELELLREYEEVYDGEGNLEKKKVIKKNGPSIMAIPLGRGKLKSLVSGKKIKNKEMETSKDEDDEIILKNCVDPKFSEEEVKAMWPKKAGAISTAILAFSMGITQSEMEGASKAVIKKKMQEMSDAQKKS